MAHNQLSASLKGAAQEFVLAIIEKAMFAKTMFALADNILTVVGGQVGVWRLLGTKSAIKGEW